MDEFQKSLPTQNNGYPKPYFTKRLHFLKKQLTQLKALGLLLAFKE